jgi:hypothetical protein
VVLDSGRLGSRERRLVIESLEGSGDRIEILLAKDDPGINLDLDYGCWYLHRGLGDTSNLVT